MKSFLPTKLRAWFPQLNSQIWILATGRFLSEVGTGFTLFYAPIFFAKGVGLSATEVGLGLGSASISGVFGRIIGGSLSDSQFWGRRRTLLLSAAISTISSFALAATNNFFTFVLANLLGGFGIGLYWPATEAAVADLTEGQVRQEAYAVVRLADNLGLGLGIILGGILISFTSNYRPLFIIDGISFIIFFAVVYLVIKETYKGNDETLTIKRKSWLFLPHSWQTALSDRLLLVFVLVNILFTTYISQLHSTIGYAIGPPLGGWAIDQNAILANSFWLVLAFSVTILIAILQYLNYIFKR